MVGLGSLAAVALAHLVAGAGLAAMSLKLYERGVLLGLTSGVVAVASVVALDWLIGTGLLRATVREMQQLAAASGLMAVAAQLRQLARSWRVGLSVRQMTGTDR